jgi:hypothetical protein|tara:strand:+ start:49 stop:327 length:279 start_codon:yes stop_codon:yes gene_type:complete
MVEEEVEENTLGVESLTEKIYKQKEVVATITDNIEQLGATIQQQQQNLQLNQGALLQLESLLKELHPDGPPDPRIPLVGDKTTSEGEEKVTT